MAGRVGHGRLAVKMRTSLADDLSNDANNLARPCQLEAMEKLHFSERIVDIEKCGKTHETCDSGNDRSRIVEKESNDGSDQQPLDGRCQCWVPAKRRPRVVPLHTPHLM